MSIPITRLERWHYKKECQIFSDMYKATGKTEWIRIPALIATEKCTVIRVAAQIGAIAELTFNGLKLTLNPYQSVEQRQYGWTLLKNVPYKSLNVIGSIIFGTVIAPIWIAIDSNFYILLFTEQAKVDWTHADRDTIGTQEHTYDLEEGAMSKAKHGQKNWKNQVE